MAGNKVGRPTKRTPELIDRLLTHLAEAGTVSGFCRLPDTPSSSTIETWAREDAELSGLIARARARGCDAMEQEYEEVSKTPSTHEDDVAHRRLRLHALEKRLTWNDPERYGQKKSVEHKHKHAHIHQMSETERELRIRELLKKGGAEVEVTIEGEDAAEDLDS